ncbi:amidophosphoribosyltransferase [Capsulimonas corticalis]|uniref:Amidophosphoribosyltransferase n=1 Tax=Capsulimonas corticalis TaxID=2219043 RepID=A0A402CSV5_9BACT|nr:ComF family protein [Capsulimonas corticalis]BDI30956.1 amidophosphoribosyltransferase [Capsulimonas corticalis]
MNPNPHAAHVPTLTRAARRLFVSAADPFLSLLYPPKCATCGLLGSALICDQCLAQFTPPPNPSCVQCGLSSGEAEACRHCARRPPAFDRARALGSYDGVLRHAIHLFKYRDRPQLAEPLGRVLALYFQTADLFPTPCDLIVPVPMHPTRRRVRGYNQSERLARVLSQELAIPRDTTSLRRVRNTRPQVGLASGARESNLLGAFAVRDATNIAGKTLLLLDDVSTTGASIHECAAALKSAGAKTVYALTLAAG